MDYKSSIQRIAGVYSSMKAGSYSQERMFLSAICTLHYLFLIPTGQVAHDLEEAIGDLCIS
jgi:hypothetical protein